MGLNDRDRRRLENEITDNPQIGAVMRGTGGLRKMRFSFEGKGKSGSSRVLYVILLSMVGSISSRHTPKVRKKTYRRRNGSFITR
jgi:hypothetical protein